MKSSKKRHTDKVAEPQAVYGIDVNELKLTGINALMSIENPGTLEKAVNFLLKSANLPSLTVPKEEETIGKEEILAGIREGLLELKEMRRTGKKGKTLQELIDEL